MVECPSCHRTGFTEAELTAHQGGKDCVDLTPREAVEHTKWTEGWMGLKVTIESASDALAKELADLKANYGDLKDQLAELAKALEESQKAAAEAAQAKAAGAKA